MKKVLVSFVLSFTTTVSAQTKSLKELISWASQNAQAPHIAVLRLTPEEFKSAHERLGQYRSFPVALRQNNADDQIAEWSLRSDELARFLEDLRSVEFKKSDYQKAFKEMSVEERMRLYLQMGDSSLEGQISGDQIRVFAPYFIAFEPSFSESEVLSLLETVSQISTSEWDGQAYRIKYSNPEDEIKVRILAKILKEERYLSVLLNYFRAHPHYFRDTNTEIAQSRTEPIDMISEVLFQNVSDRISSGLFRKNVSFQIQPSEISRLIRLSLRNRWSPDATLDLDRGPVGAFMAPAANEIVLICPQKESITQYEPTQIGALEAEYTFSPYDYLQIRMLRINRDRLKDLQGLAFEWTCGTERFHGAISIPQSKQANADLQISFPDFKTKGHLDVVMTFGMSPRLPDELRNGMRLYLEAQGWAFVKEEQIEQTESSVLEKLIQSDAIVPIAHAIDQGRLQFGFEHSVQMSFSRKMENGLEQNLALVVPSSSAQTNQEILLTREQIISVLKKRNENGRSAWLVLNLTCRGATLIPGWAAIIRDAELPQSQTPLVIGSKDGFTASSMAGYQALAKFFDRFVTGISESADIETLKAVMNQAIAGDSIQIPQGFNTVTNLDPEFQDLRTGDSHLELQIKTFRSETLIHLK